MPDKLSRSSCRELLGKPLVIWQSIPLMIVIDATILLIVGTMAVYLWRNWSLFNHPRQVRFVRMIVIGMFTIAAFHLADLIIMTVMPSVVGEQEAMILMRELALNAP